LFAEFFLVSEARGFPVGLPTFPVGAASLGAAGAANG